MADRRLKASAPSAPGGAALGRHSSMLGALIKKQFMELSTLYSFSKRRTKNGSTGGFVITLLLYVLIAVSVGASMMALGMVLGDELLGKGEDWKYFLLMDVLGISLATLITMFSADLTLFRAKDNEILLSMPIPPGYILLSRMVPLYVIALIFTSSVVIPEIVMYREIAGMSLPLIILNVLILLVLAFLALALSSVLGWLISLINVKLKGNSLASMLITVIFLGAYFFVYFQFGRFSAALLQRSSAIADTLRYVLPPLYFLGKGHTGSFAGLAIGIAGVILVFGVIYWALSRSFRAIVINAGKTTTRKVGSGTFKVGTQSQDLFMKERKRFLSSTSYMMNCGLGSVFMIVLSVIAVVKRDALLEFTSVFEDLFEVLPNFFPGVLALLIFMLVSTCYYTMPSISLEGKSIWILQSLPLDPMKIFISKIKMEYILCVPGILVMDTVICVLLKLSVLSWCAVLLASLAYTTFTAFFGLWINLLRPNMDWTNEAYPIKQGLNPLICLFGEWLLTFVLGGIYFLIGAFVPSEAYLLLVTVVLLVISYVFWRWLHTGGRARFEAL